jgi:hypothetical protein
MAKYAASFSQVPNPLKWPLGQMLGANLHTP